MFARIPKNPSVTVIVSNGNRTKWSPIQSVIMPVTDKIYGNFERFISYTVEVKQKGDSSALAMACSIQLLRHDIYCPINAKIRSADRQLSYYHYYYIMIFKKWFRLD